MNLKSITVIENRFTACPYCGVKIFDLDRHCVGCGAPAAIPDDVWNRAKEPYVGTYYGTPITASGVYIQLKADTITASGIPWPGHYVIS